MAKCLGSLVVSQKTFEYYTSGRYIILSELVTDREAVSACLKFAGIQQIEVTMKLLAIRKHFKVNTCFCHMGFDFHIYLYASVQVHTDCEEVL